MEVDIAWENNGKLDLCEIKAGSTFHDDMAKNIWAIERLLLGEIGRNPIVYSGRKTSTADGIQVKPFDNFCFWRNNINSHLHTLNQYHHPHTPPKKSSCKAIDFSILLEVQP